MNCDHDWKINPADEKTPKTTRICQKCQKTQVWQWLEKEHCYGWPKE